MRFTAVLLVLVLLLGLAAAFALLPGCGSSSSTTSLPEDESNDGPAWFEDATDRLGIHFTHDPGPVEKYWMFQAVGSGCAIHDLDGDGRPDLLLLTNGGPESASTNKLFRQRADGAFEDVSAGSGLDFPGWNMGIAVGDANNDGLPDVVITQYTGTRLFLNLGGMKFADISAEAGIKNPLWGTSAAFLDYDRDGRLDLFICNYVGYDRSWPCRSASGEADYCAPMVFHGTASKLFRNRGAADGKRVAFEDVSVASRIGELTGPGLGIAVADFDGDGWPDVFVANDGKPNHLWMNRRNETFAEEAATRGVAYTRMGHAYAGMGVALGDVDNDGLLDLYVTHLTSETNTLWKQGPRGNFRDATLDAGLTATKWRGTGFGAVMADFDLNGSMDIAVANGRVQRESPARDKPGVAAHWTPYAERNQLLANAGGGRFQDVSPHNRAFSGYFTVARGMACGDIDGDGAPDLLVNAAGEKARLFRNVAPNRGHWIVIRALDPALKREALGAEVAVTAGGVRRVRVITSADSFLSAGPPVAHFGLGAGSIIEAVEVTWPDGMKESFSGGPADQIRVVRKGSAPKG
jgi:hypothetical protein